MGRLQTTTSLGRFRWPGSGFRALGLWGLGFRVYSRVWGLGFRVYSRLWGLGFRVYSRLLV